MSFVCAVLCTDHKKTQGLHQNGPSVWGLPRACSGFWRDLTLSIEPAKARKPGRAHSKVSVCVCVCVLVYVYLCVHGYACVCACLHACVYAYLCLCDAM